MTMLGRMALNGMPLRGALVAIALSVTIVAVLSELAIRSIP